MVDAVTNNYSITQPLVGGDLNTWGTVLNNGALAVIDASLGSSLAVSITANDVTLTTTQFQNAVFVLSGTLTGNRNLIVPLSPNSATVACGGKFVVVNDTSGAFNVTVKTAASGSKGVIIPQGFAVEVYSDGTDVGYSTSGLPGYAYAYAGDPNGHLAGTAGSANTNASIAYDYTNNKMYFCTTTGDATTAVWTQISITIPRGFDMPVNFGLVASHTGGNLLTVAVKTSAGVDATALSPIIVPFQTLSGTATTGAPTFVNITAALSISTFALGASLGSSNGVPFRFWIGIFNNAGTPVLALRNCSDANGVYSVAEYGVASTTGMSAGATSAGVWYTPNGTALASKPFRLVGYLEYTSGLVTAGTYISDPSNVVLFGPGIKKPGDVVQTIYSSTTTPTTINSTTNTATALTASITPTSAINPVKVAAYGQVRTENNALQNVFIAQLYRNTGSVAIGNMSTAQSSAPGAAPGSLSTPTVNFAFDTPASVSPTQYGLYGKLSAGADNFVWLSTTRNVGTNTGVMTLDEIMG